jgi:hypothetical protein
MFGATDSEDANEPLIGEKVLELINKGENADGNELKKYDFTIDGFDVKSITPTKPASKKRGDITKLVSAAKEYKGTISQG